jgi:hypothetical protein
MKDVLATVNAEISAIDQSIEVQVKRLDQLHMQLNFEAISEFTLTEATEALCDASFNRSGLYFFEIHNHDQVSDPTLWIKNFEPNWINRGFKWHSGIKKGRLTQHQMFNEWIPFYIGKSRFVGKRVNEHILQPSEKSTFSMKLKSTNTLHGNRFRVSWLPVNVKNYDMIVPNLERLMRNRFNPIVGKQ